VQAELLVFGHFGCIER